MVYLNDLHRCYATLLESHDQVSYLQLKTLIKKSENVQKTLPKPLRLGKTWLLVHFEAASPIATGLDDPLVWLNRTCFKFLIKEACWRRSGREGWEDYWKGWLRGGSHGPALANVLDNSAC